MLKLGLNGFSARYLERVDSLLHIRLENHLQIEHDNILFQEEIHWYQISWIMINELYTQTIIGRQRNKIIRTRLLKYIWSLDIDNSIIQQEAQTTLISRLSSRAPTPPQLPKKQFRHDQSTPHWLRWPFISHQLHYQRTRWILSKLQNLMASNAYSLRNIGTLWAMTSLTWLIMSFPQVTLIHLSLIPLYLKLTFIPPPLRTYAQLAFATLFTKS